MKSEIKRIMYDCPFCDKEQEDINNIKTKIIKHKKVLKELRRGNK